MLLYQEDGLCHLKQSPLPPPPPPILTGLPTIKECIIFFSGWFLYLPPVWPVALDGVGGPALISSSHRGANIPGQKDHLFINMCLCVFSSQFFPKIPALAQRHFFMYESHITVDTLVYQNPRSKQVKYSLCDILALFPMLMVLFQGTPATTQALTPLYSMTPSCLPLAQVYCGLLLLHPKGGAGD